MAFAPASPPSGRCRTAGGWVGTRPAADAAGPAAAATTAPADSTDRAARAAARSRAEGPSLVALRWRHFGSAMQAEIMRRGAHAGVKRKQELGRRTIRAVNAE